MTNPMDSVPMPEPLSMSMVASRNDFKYTSEQLRAYGLSAYEMGRNAGLEEARKFAEEWLNGDYCELPNEIRSLKR